MKKVPLKSRSSVGFLILSLGVPLAASGQSGSLGDPAPSVQAPGASERIGRPHAPEMATLGDVKAPDSAVPRPVVRPEDDFARFESRYADPSMQTRRPMPQSQRIESSRLSTRLGNSSNSLLQSRLFGQRKAAAGNAREGGGLDVPRR